jgi:copper chaperone CopZ
MNEFERKVRAAAIAGWWVVLIAVVFLTVQWIAYLAIMNTRPAWILAMWGPNLDWAFVQMVWFWGVATLKFAVWLMALGSLWLTLLAICLLGCQNRPQPTETREFAIEGMSCEGCANTVATALKAIPGVQSVEVSLKDKKAAVVANRVSPQVIEDAIGKAGYKARVVAGPVQLLHRLGVALERQ